MWTVGREGKPKHIVMLLSKPRSKWPHLVCFCKRRRKDGTCLLTDGIRPLIYAIASAPHAGFFAVIYPCPECGQKAGTTYSGSVICECGMLHAVCASCGVQADPCWEEYDACGCERCHPEIHNKPVES